MASTHDCTFWELWALAPQLCITIPALQRDYAQGRRGERTIREAFLTRIRRAVVDEEDLQLDFVYGNLREMEGGETQFVPIDGQQRLTTLFLLHWYGAWMSDAVTFETWSARACLSDGRPAFCYETRVSAQEFCRALVQPSAWALRPKGSELDLEAWLKAQTWFYASWAIDPTVGAMLVMLGDVHRLFYAHHDRLWTALVDERRLTFAWLNLDEWQLTDDLYLKMNSRGRPLTDFENFKAALNAYLKERHPERAHRLAQKLDRSWSDALWRLSQQAGVDYDTAWMRLLEFWLERLAQCYPTGEVKERGAYALELSALDSVGALEVLEGALDGLAATIARAPEGVCTFFGALWDPETLPLHDIDADLLMRCLKGTKFDRRAQVLLFSVWYFLVETQQPYFRINQSLKDFARLSRNLVWSMEEPRRDYWEPALTGHRQKGLLQTLLLCFAKKHLYAHLAALEEGQLPDYVSRALVHEMDKARLIQAHRSYRPWIHRLEDHPLLRGNLTNFPLEKKLTLKRLRRYVRHFETLWDLEQVPDACRIRALLEWGDYSVCIGNSALGEVWYFGKGRHWARLLRAAHPEMRQVLSAWLASVVDIPTADLLKVVQQRLNTIEVPSEASPWQQLFMRYPVVLEGEGAHVGYVFDGESDQDYRLEKLLGKTLRSPHVNAYVEALAQALEAEDGLVYGRSHERSYLQLETGVQFQADKGQWLIYGLEELEGALAHTFGLEQDMRYKNPSMHKLPIPLGSDPVALAGAFWEAFARSKKSPTQQSRG